MDPYKFNYFMAIFNYWPIHHDFTVVNVSLASWCFTRKDVSYSAINLQDHRTYSLTKSTKKSVANSSIIFGNINGFLVVMILYPQSFPCNFYDSSFADWPVIYLQVAYIVEYAFLRGRGRRHFHNRQYEAFNTKWWAVLSTDKCCQVTSLWLEKTDLHVLLKAWYCLRSLLGYAGRAIFQGIIFLAKIPEPGKKLAISSQTGYNFCDDFLKFWKILKRIFLRKPFVGYFPSNTKVRTVKQLQGVP